MIRVHLAYVNNSQKSIFLTGILIVSYLIFIFSINPNKVFAIEYNNYTSGALGIKFEYPNNWNVDKSDEDLDILYITDPDGEKGILIFKYNNEEIDIGSGLQNFTEQELKDELELLKEEDPDSISKIIEKPTIISAGNLSMGTFLTTEEYKDENNNTYTDASQFWTILEGERGYSIEFYAPTSTFNSPEVSEIVDHFIKSVKIVSEEDQSTTTPPPADDIIDKGNNTSSNQPTLHIPSVTP